VLQAVLRCGTPCRLQRELTSPWRLVITSGLPFILISCSFPIGRIAGRIMSYGSCTGRYHRGGVLRPSGKATGMILPPAHSLNRSSILQNQVIGMASVIACTLGRFRTSDLGTSLPIGKQVRHHQERNPQHCQRGSCHQREYQVNIRWQEQHKWFGGYKKRC